MRRTFSPISNVHQTGKPGCTFIAGCLREKGKRAERPFSPFPNRQPGGKRAATAPAGARKP